MTFAPTFFSLFGRLHRCHVLQHASRRERLEGGLLHDVGTAARRQSRGAHGGKSPHRRGYCMGNGARSAQGARRGTNRFDCLRCFERYRKCGVLGFSHGAASTLRRTFQTQGFEHRFHQRQSRGRRGTHSTLSRGVHRHDTPCSLRESAHLCAALGQEVPEPCPIGQRTQCGLFHLSEVSLKCAPDDLLDQLGRTSQSLLQAHLAHAWGDAVSHLRGLSFGLCCQGENGRDVCKTAAVFSGMENQVKRQRKINTTNSPPAWGTSSRRGRTKENLTHFFGHYLYTRNELYRESSINYITVR